MQAITVSWDSKGKSTQVFGPEVEAKKQSQYIKKLKAEGLEKGVVLVEMWSRASGFVMAAKRTKEELLTTQKEGEEAKKAFQAKKEQAVKGDLERSKNQSKNKTIGEAIAEMRKENGAKEPKKEK